MVKHSFYIPLARQRKSLVQCLFCASLNEFRTELSLRTVDVKHGANWAPGVSFNLECSKTGDKQTLIAFDMTRLDIETVMHEVLHAMHWAHSDANGTFSLDTHVEQTEEDFIRDYEDMTRHVVRFAEQRLGAPLPYIRGETQEQAYEKDLPQEIKDIINDDGY